MTSSLNVTKKLLVMCQIPREMPVEKGPPTTVASLVVLTLLGVASKQLGESQGQILRIWRIFLVPHWFGDAAQAHKRGPPHKWLDTTSRCAR